MPVEISLIGQLCDSFQKKPLSMKPMESMTGEICQIPPMYLQLKVNGQALIWVERVKKRSGQSGRWPSIVSERTSPFPMKMSKPAFVFESSAARGPMSETLSADFGSQAWLCQSHVPADTTSSAGMSLDDAWPWWIAERVAVDDFLSPTTARNRRSTESELLWRAGWRMWERPFYQLDIRRSWASWLFIRRS